jgi:radical SAM superfamily enzyme YgiQ (UPF0313 family)
MNVTHDIAIVSVNARYTHTSLGMRYVYANLGELRSRASCSEVTINDAPDVIVKRILESDPVIVAMGVYIWNRTVVEAVVRGLRAQAPELLVVLGGPEISYDTESDLARAATCVLCGEAETVFPEVCTRLLNGETVPQVLSCDPVDLDAVVLPYEEYSEEDIANRVLYVETSRGCPYGCEYCMSSLDPSVRKFPVERVLLAFEQLLARGALRFKFVDRSFNLDTARAGQVLRFFLERWREGMILHLEMTPDRLSQELREVMCAFSAGALHVEVGVQTFNPEVAERVGRRLDVETVEQGIRFLVEEAHADVHADLIAGLPGETSVSFEAGVDRLVALNPAELQVGILKRLHGAPIGDRVAEWQMQFSEVPPYEIRCTSTMTAAYLDGVTRFAMHWDRVVNRQLLPRSVSLIWRDAPSAFDAFNRFSCFLESREGRQGFGLVELCRALFDFLVQHVALPADDVRAVLREDYLDGGRRIGLPTFLR